ncbi:MAG: holo-ACP synthase [bacterium]|nr:holo-ACP synthase [bacterium]
MIGIDIVDVPRFGALLARRPSVAERLFTPAERAYAEARADPTERLAARFAAKEAVMKALGAGFGDVAFRDMEVVRAPGGKPEVRLHGRAAARARRAGVTGWHLSLSHTATSAVAVAVAVAADGIAPPQEARSDDPA